MEDAIYIDRITKFEWKVDPSQGEESFSQNQAPCQSSSPSKVRRLDNPDDYCSGQTDGTGTEEAPAVVDCSNDANAASFRSSLSLNTSAITKIKKSLSLFHKEQYGSPLEMEYKKGRWEVSCFVQFV